MRILRIRFSKSGDAAYISHLDMQRVMHRAISKAQLPAWYSLGFNPHIYLTFPLPLPLGQDSVCEAMDFKTEDDTLQFGQVMERLNSVLPAGIRVLDCYEAVHAAKDITHAAYTIQLPAAPDVEAALTACNECKEILITKLGKQDGRKTQKQVDLRPHIPQLCWEKAGEWIKLQLQLAAGSTVNVNPASLIQYIGGMCQTDLSCAAVVRTNILTKDGTAFH